jgi:hypothetical protein
MAVEMGAGFDELASAYVPTVRHMIARGFLELNS